MNVIMRPACNRPEMLCLSIESEIKARERHKFSSDLITVFVVDLGYDQKTMEIIHEYPYAKDMIIRDEKCGLSKNILEGMKFSFARTDDYIIYIEDDIVLHKTYFEYIDKLLDMFDTSEYSVLMGYNMENTGDVNEVSKSNFYKALATLMRKDFFDDYLKPCVSSIYYKDFNTRDKFVRALGNKYMDYWETGYKYGGNRVGDHNEQMGLTSRLIDIAMIAEEKYTILPEISRAIHIGFYGKNRPGGIPGKTYDERLALMRDVIKNNRFYELTSMKQYNDYFVFSDKLENWDGNLYAKEKNSFLYRRRYR